MFAKINDSISIEYNHTIFRYASYKFWKEFRNIFVSSKSNSNYPSPDIFLPLSNHLNPRFKKSFKFFFIQFDLLLNIKHGMHNEIRRVWFNGSGWCFRAKYMRHVSSNSKGGHSGVVRWARKLITASNDSNFTVLTLLRIPLKRRKDRLDFGKKLLGFHINLIDKNISNIWNI